MGTIKIFLTAATFALLLNSCSQADRSATSKAYTSAATDSAGSAPDEARATSAAPPAAAATQPYESSDRKIIRNADFRCRVKDVFIATTHIEKLVKSTGGAITDSRMETDAGTVRTLPYGADSLRQLQPYTTTAQLTLRIPVESLDTVLSDVAAQSAFINTRHLQLSDVTLKILSNELRSRAAQGYASNGHSSIATAETRDANVINRKIENLDLMDNVRYATLTLAFYQPERIDATVVANTTAMLQPGPGQRMRTALIGGWALVQDAALLLIYVWPLLLAGVAVLIYMRRRKIRRLTPVSAT